MYLLALTSTQESLWWITLGIALIVPAAIALLALCSRRLRRALGGIWRRLTGRRGTAHAAGPGVCPRSTISAAPSCHEVALSALSE